jgi:hypothetical protein
MMFRAWLNSIIAALLLAGTAWGTPYWIDWEGADWPENQGWTRNWGNWNGQYQGPGAYRTLEDGILTYDSLYDPGVCDFYYMDRPGQMDPGAGELFVMEWRLKVDQVNGSYDPTIGVFSDSAWVLGFEYAADHVSSVFENYATIPFIQGEFHQYRVVSPDMRNYALYIDGALAHEGAFVHVVSQSEFGWGDGVQGASSLHHWDYVRYGVIPEPSGYGVVLMWVTLWRSARRG